MRSQYTESERDKQGLSQRTDGSRKVETNCATTRRPFSTATWSREEKHVQHGHRPRGAQCWSKITHLSSFTTKPIPRRHASAQRLRACRSHVPPYHRTARKDAQNNPECMVYSSSKLTKQNEVKTTPRWALGETFLATVELLVARTWLLQPTL